MLRKVRAWAVYRPNGDFHLDLGTALPHIYGDKESAFKMSDGYEVVEVEIRPLKPSKRSGWVSKLCVCRHSKSLHTKNDGCVSINSIGFKCLCNCFRLAPTGVSGRK